MCVHVYYIGRRKRRRARKNKHTQTRALRATCTRRNTFIGSSAMVKRESGSANVCDFPGETAARGGGADRPHDNTAHSIFLCCATQKTHHVITNFEECAGRVQSSCVARRSLVVVVTVIVYGQVATKRPAQAQNPIATHERDKRPRRAQCRVFTMIAGYALALIRASTAYDLWISYTTAAVSSQRAATPCACVLGKL